VAKMGTFQRWMKRRDHGAQMWADGRLESGKNWRVDALKTDFVNTRVEAMERIEEIVEQLQRDGSLPELDTASNRDTQRRN
jgi:hypothetical protein